MPTNTSVNGQAVVAIADHPDRRQASFTDFWRLPTRPVRNLGATLREHPYLTAAMVTALALVGMADAGDPLDDAMAECYAQVKGMTVDAVRRGVADGSLEVLQGKERHQALMCIAESSGFEQTMSMLNGLMAVGQRMQDEVNRAHDGFMQMNVFPGRRG